MRNMWNIKRRPGFNSDRMQLKVEPVRVSGDMTALFGKEVTDAKGHGGAVLRV